MKYTVITKDGSKWLTVVPSKPIWGNEKEWMEEVLSEDLPYLGSHPEGTVLSEEQVSVIYQTSFDGVSWIEVTYDDYIDKGERYPVRIAYTDAEPPDIDYEKEMPHKEWPSTKYVARKVDAESHDRHISDNPRYQLFSHMSDEHGLTLLDSELDEIARHAAPMTGVDYWKRRCKAAERFIEQSPCDPDITPKQIEAHEAWQEIIEEGRAYGN